MAVERRVLWHLRRIPFFDGVNAEAVSRLARSAELLELKRRHVLYLPGDPGASVYFIHAGRVKISKVTRDGKELALRYYGPGELLGEICLIDGGPREEMAEIVEAASLSQIERATFENFVRTQPDMAYRLATLGLRRLRELEYRVEFLIFKDVGAKLAELLLKLTEEHGREDPRGTMVAIRITHQEMANLIGSTRETVSLTVSQFRKKGYVQCDGRKVIVSDPEGLRALCV